MMDLARCRTAFCAPRGVMRRPQISGTFQQLVQVRLVQPGQIGFAAVIR
jgi:hypothetical protein